MTVKVVHNTTRDTIATIDLPAVPPPGSYIRLENGSKWRVRQLWFDVSGKTMIAAVLPFPGQDGSIST